MTQTPSPSEHAGYEAIRVRRAPSGTQEQLVYYERPLPFLVAEQEVTLRVWYIPEKFCLDQEPLEQYFLQLPVQIDSLELLAHQMLQDVTNALIPFWVRVLVEWQGEQHKQRVLCEEQQPDWGNPELVSLAKI